MCRPPSMSNWMRAPQHAYGTSPSDAWTNASRWLGCWARRITVGLGSRLKPALWCRALPLAPCCSTAFGRGWPAPPRRVLDLCCGSGCLGLLAAQQFPAAEVVLVDADARAASLAQRNAVALGLEDRTEVACGDLFDGAPSAGFDLILCNPPYVDAADMRSLPPEFAHEPALGLAGGEDGLNVVRRVIDQAAQHLEEGGLLVCEVGMNAWRVNRAWPRLPFIWPHTPAGSAEMFVLDAAALVSHTAAIPS